MNLKVDASYRSELHRQLDAALDSPEARGWVLIFASVGQNGKIHVRGGLHGKLSSQEICDVCSGGGAHLIAIHQSGDAAPTGKETWQ